MHLSLNFIYFFFTGKLIITYSPGYVNCNDMLSLFYLHFIEMNVTYYRYNRLVDITITVTKCRISRLEWLAADCFASSYMGSLKYFDLNPIDFLDEERIQ